MYMRIYMYACIYTGVYTGLLPVYICFAALLRGLALRPVFGVLLWDKNGLETQPPLEGPKKVLEPRPPHPTPNNPKSSPCRGRVPTEACPQKRAHRSVPTEACPQKCPRKCPRKRAHRFLN